MCLVKVRGEVEDEVIVPARVVERDSRHRHETQIVGSAPAVIERPPPIQRPSRSHRYSSNSSSASSSSGSSRSSVSYTGRHGRRTYRASHQGGGGSSYDDRSRSGRSRSRERSYYRDGERVVSGGGYERNGSAVRSSFRYVDPQPRGSRQEVRHEIARAEEHLQRAAELQERERRIRDPRSITYHDHPRSSTASYGSYARSRDGSRHRNDVVVVQTERHRDRYSR